MKANEFTIKADKTLDYVNKMQLFMDQQTKVTGIERTLADDWLDCMDPPVPGRGPCQAKNGYLKVCTDWLARFWLDDPSKPLENLSKSMTKFDTCGANDKDGGAIEKGSDYEDWQTALNFLEWYGIPQMEGFGIILIDN